MRNIFIVSMFLLASCGNNVSVPAEVHVSGTVNLHLDLTDITRYFTAICKEELVNYSQDQLDACVGKKIEKLTVILNNSGV